MSTRILAFDPAIELTGWCSLVEDGTDRGTLSDFGLIRNTDERALGLRGSSLGVEVGQLIKAESPDVVVVEMPAATKRAWGGYRNRAALSGPVYGFAVGCVWTAARLSPGAFVLQGVPADEWSIGIRKGDDQKTSRVQFVTWLYQLSEGQLGPKTTAGNVADAILIARWALLQRSLTNTRT